jgi:IS5 family transposase
MMDREIESETCYNVMIKWFIRENLDDHLYDHSELGRFRDIQKKRKSYNIIMTWNK